MIFVFLMFLIKILTIKSIISFKVIQKSNCVCYFIVMSDGIFDYNDVDVDYKTELYEFNIIQRIISQEDFDSISLNMLLNNSYIFFIKNFIYFFDEKENLNIFLNSDNEIYSSQIIPLENNLIYDSNTSIYYFIAFADKKKNLNINFYRMKKTISDTFENEKISSINDTIDSKYFSCQLMYETFYENILTCFYKNEDSLLEANSFIVENNSVLKNVFNSSIILKNDGNNINLKSIKSILSENSSLCFVCDITDVNNTCECLLYDINKNEINYYGIYLDKCLSNYSSLDIIT